MTTAVFKWKIENYRDRLRLSISGDVWASDVFTLYKKDNPRCYLKFQPPVRRVQCLPPDRLFMPLRHSDSSIDLVFLDTWPTGLNPRIWAEDEDAQVATRKQYSSADCPGYFNDGFIWSWNESTLVICCEYDIHPSDELHHEHSQPPSAPMVVDRSAAPAKLRFDEIRVNVPFQAQRKEFEFDGNRILLEKKLGYSFEWKNLEPSSDALYHYEVWMQNASDYRTYRFGGFEPNEFAFMFLVSEGIWTLRELEQKSE